MQIISGKLTRAHSNDAGMDIYSTENKIIPERSNASVSTNLRIKLEPNTTAFVKPRSGLSFKYHIETGAGVIDESYSGEIKVKLYNHGDQPYKINKDDKIAQLVILPVIYPKLENQNQGARGEKGFGSSGK